MSSLIKKSQKALNVFTRVAEDLKGINLSLISAKETELQKEEKAKLTRELYQTQIEKNTGVIKNIEKILK